MSDYNILSSTSACLPISEFDRASEELDRSADSLQTAAKKQRTTARANVDRAERHAGSAVGAVGGAAVNVLLATGKTVEGGAQALIGARQLAASASLATLGAAAWTAEGVASGARLVARNAARGFAGIANGLSRVLGDGKSVTVRELEADPKATRFSERLLGAAGQQLGAAAGSTRAAWSSWVGAVTHLAGSAVNAGAAAAHTAAVAGNLAAAAARTGASAGLELTAHGARLGATAVRAAEEGVEGARELAILSARFSAAAANTLAQPDHPRLEVTARRQLAACSLEVRQLLERCPALGPLAGQLAAAR